MSYQLVYTHRAVKDLAKISHDIKRRIGKALLRYTNSPLDYAETLVNSDLGSYRLRIGDYRVIFDIEGAEIVILRVGHRKEIYKRR